MSGPEPSRPQTTGEAGSWNFVSDDEQNIPDDEHELGSREISVRKFTCDD